MTETKAWTWHWPSLGVSLQVSLEASETLINSRQNKGESERGGQLFVNMMHEDGIWLVTATPPHANDLATPRSLALNPTRCQQEIEVANKGGLRLIGYWHTHPENIPHLSHQDLKSFREFSKLHCDLLPNPVAVIVGRSDSRDGIKAWSMQADAALEAEHLDSKAVK